VFQRYVYPVKKHSVKCIATLRRGNLHVQG